MLSSYLSPSRHGIYYFRWPIPHTKEGKRTSIRISLRTHCPDRAGDLARHLASCGRILRENNALAGLRQSEIREKVQTYFKAQLDQYLDWLDRRGLSKNALKDIREEMLDHESFLEMETDFPKWLPVERFKRVMDVSDEEWNASQPRITHQLRQGRRDMLRRVLEAAGSQASCSFGYAPSAAFTAPPAPALDASSPLGAAVEEFTADQARRLPDKTVKQNRAYLGILLEYFGPERLLGSITKQDANKVKQVLHDLPSNRKVKTALKGLPLIEAVKVPGQSKISDKTIDSHIQMFAAFFQWAETHGHAPHRLFEGMKLGKRAKKNEIKRKPFTPEQAQRILTELTENTSGLLRSESHKWGMLLALFTGARLNEICQLHIADVQQEDGIWFLDITDEGDDDKKLKTEAGRRKVPVYSELIRLGFLEFVQSRSKGKRLFPDYENNINGG